MRDQTARGSAISTVCRPRYPKPDHPRVVTCVFSRGRPCSKREELKKQKRKTTKKTGNAAVLRQSAGRGNASRGRPIGRRYPEWTYRTRLLWGEPGFGSRPTRLRECRRKTQPLIYRRSRYHPLFRLRPHKKCPWIRIFARNREILAVTPATNCLSAHQPRNCGPASEVGRGAKNAAPPPDTSSDAWRENDSDETL